MAATSRKTSSGALPDYLVIVDFEATCNDSNGCKNPPPKPQEIIEFPAVLLNVKTREVEDEFHHYILPDVHPRLSSFCTELTGITQETVDQGISLKEALRLHDEWIDRHNLTNDITNQEEGKSRFLYVACGDWDFKTCLPNQLAYHNQTVPELFSNWVNIKKHYGNFYNRKAQGMTTLLQELDLNLEGRHHSGIDDSRNIARICARMLEDGWRPLASTQKGSQILMNGNYARIQKQPKKKVDYLVVVDFEATCNDSNGGKNPPPKPQEIIEFPAVLLNVKTREIEDEFHHYILPDVHPQLSSFCTELTGITQETVDQGISLKEALHLHYEWINRHNLTNDRTNQEEGKSRFLYVTDGDWDFKTCLRKQLAYHNQTVPELFSDWVDIRKHYGNFYNRKPRGITTLLEELGLDLEGRHHSGIDDSKNIARICARMLEDGWKPLATAQKGSQIQMNANYASIQKSKKPKEKVQQKKKTKEPLVIEDKSQCKTVFLIRHGQSEGQAARAKRMSHEGEEFMNCGLTDKGYKQAEEISSLLEQDPDAADIDLIISSPLRRALQTAVLGFPPDRDILVHYDMREIGSRVPENMPQPMPQVLKSLEKDLRDRPGNIDTESLQPKGWPDNVNISRQETVRNAFQWLYQERPEKCIAVVCHYNVIRSMLMPNVQGNIVPKNAIPIKCILTPDGKLVPEQEGQF